MVRGTALSGLVMAGVGFVSAQTYTITETVNACEASYSSSAPYTVTMMSSMTVSPSPSATLLSDANLNTGSLFVIQVSGYSGSNYLASRAVPQDSWLTSNGSLTTNNATATQYRITSGRLFTSDGLCVSANSSLSQTVLSASAECGPFSGNFTFKNDVLNWTNPAFFDGTAQFFSQYNNTSNTTQVMAMLNGLLNAQQLADRLVLYGRTPSQAAYSASTAASRSSAISAYGSPSPSSSLIASPNGLCGGSTGYTCSGGTFGFCCSSYGYCGSSSEYCGTRCQATFGICSPAGQSVSSSVSSGLTSSLSPYSNLSATGVQKSMSSMASLSTYSSQASVSSRFGPGPVYPDSMSASTSTSSTSSFMAYSPQGTSSTTSSSSPMSYGQSTSSISTTSSSSPLNAYSMSNSGSSTSMSSSSPMSSSIMSSSSAAISSTSMSVAGYSSSSSPAAYASTSSTASSSSSPMVSSSISTTSSMSSSMTSSTTSAFAPYVSATSYVSTPAECPADDGDVVQDDEGVQWMLYCSSDSTGTSTVNDVVNGTFNDCFDMCNAQPASTPCAAFTYVGIGTEGYCYFKATFGSPIAQGSNYISAKRLSQGTFPISMASSSSSSTTSSAPSSSSVASSTSTIMSLSSSGGGSAPSSSSATSSSSQAPTVSSGGHTPTPTACTNFGGDPPGTDEDDSYCEIDLPFNISMYNGQANTYQTFVSTNGVFSLYDGSWAYQSEPLPDDDDLDEYSLCPFWDDLYYFASEGDGEGIYYTINEAQTTVNYTYVLSRSGSNYELWIFSIFYDSTVPGVFTFSYDSVPDSGVTATVGMQGADNNQQAVGTTYSYDQTDITPGLTVVCNTNTGVCTGSNGQTASQTYG